MKTDSEGNLLGINNLTNTQYNIQISPNPANDQCTIMINNIHGKTVSISVYNNFGQKVFVETEEKIHSTIYKKNLNLESLTPGLYFIQIKIDGQMETKKIVIQ